MSKEIKNKKGWIKVTEAFIAILLIAAVVILVAENTGMREEDSKNRISDSQILILRYIEINETLRQEIIDTNGEIEWNDEDFPENLKDRIEEKKPSWLGGIAKICSPTSDCILSDEIINELELKGENIYTQSLIITSTTSNFNPRQLKLFCWD